MIVWFVVRLSTSQVADHGVAGGVDAVDRAVEHVEEHVAAIDLVVGQLAAHDLQLAGELGSGTKAACCIAVGQQLDGGQGVLGRAVDEERGHVVAW